ncbi:APC family permease [Microbacterium saperdae]|uniref:Amino acid/polyamine/organocation transporter (APC superfamily) n=1 Tax=Microbacterium saperdae TaxID=69368 RepID=A0A543BPT9_9MICO|nr:APC family permease [Microbacterium saperdae]TQL86822.1 amino acid/polyamine/organocation transporter (APC superfamily) [Microbacterium saperdae]GGM45151.1 amino acid transporter [Microbacterium saperdae]
MPLARRLKTGDAVAIGLGSMIGAGVFSVWGPAIGVAGSGVLIALAIAAVVAYCNATASAQLAAAHPVAGGTYAYARAEIGPWWGFIAGWSFVVGKIASCAAMAMTFAAYAAPAGWQPAVAVGAVAALAAVNCFGVTRTALLTRILVACSLLGLAVVVAFGLAGAPVAAPSTLPAATAYGVLQGAGLLFFAFAGYARIATMGEEVVDPARTIPRAITLALAGAVVVYALVGITVLAVLGESATTSTAPLADVVSAVGWAPLEPLVRVSAASASLGALLALLTGIGRTTLAMARERDVPAFFSKIDERWHVPRRAEIAIALLVISIVLVADLRGAIGFSSFGVLTYYLIANAAAFRQEGGTRRYPRALQVIGALGCLLLVNTLPVVASLVGTIVIVIGVMYRLVRIRVQRLRL